MNRLKPAKGFPTRLRELRDKIGYSQEKLATVAKVSQAAISCYETGDRWPSRENALRIAKALGTTVRQLVKDRALLAPRKTGRP